jgi:hypothetical protein
MASLSNPVVEINDDLIKIKPNSLSFKKGKGEKNMRTQSAGGDSVETVRTVNAETKKSMVKFTLLTTQEAVEKFDLWDENDDRNLIRLENDDRNLIRLSEAKTSFNIVFRRMSIISDNEITVGAEGEFEVEFEGPPVL